MPYFFIFTVYLLFADAVFVFRCPKRENYIGRLIAFFVLFLGTAWVIIDQLELNKISFLSGSSAFLIIYLLTVCGARFCFDISWCDSFFYMIAGYNIQHIASIIRKVVTMYFDQIGIKEHSLLYILFPFAIIGVVCVCTYSICAKRIPHKKDIVQKKNFLPVVVLAVFAEIILFDVVVFHTASVAEIDMTYFAVICIDNVLYSILALVLQFNLIIQMSLTNQLEVVYQMLNKERKQYQVSKETIDLINLKCHDMKHQIHQIGKESISADVLREMEDVIGVYDSIIKTGNQALDTILAEKALFCQQSQISISCMADGNALSFMNESDIYSLFGNLLDNAIQAVSELEVESRLIGLFVKQQESFLSISSYNYCHEIVQIENGLPVTTKSNTDYHGYGTKSMSIIVEKYDGTILFHTKSNIFYVNILLPIKP